jgi:hypothetical protein
MYEKLLVACLLGSFATTAILAEEPGPKNESPQIEKIKFGGYIRAVPNNRPSIRIWPISILDGYTKLSLHYAVTHNVSLGIEGSHLTSDSAIKYEIKEKSLDSSIDSFDFSAQCYGVRVDYALDISILMDTPYLSVGLSKVMAGVKSRIDGTEASGDFILGRALIGFQWVKKHFIINVAGGISTTLSEEYKVKTSSRWVSEEQVKNMSSSNLDSEFSIGYVF